MPLQIPVGGGRTVVGDLDGPGDGRPGEAGLVVFAHGSGSGRHSPRNRAVAARLQRAGLTTLLADLLTPDEEAGDAAGRFRFDIDLLAERLELAIAAAARAAPPQPIGLFGASTGAAAALVAAARLPLVRAVVSRGGRPDLAGDRLHDVRAPTLLVVGSADVAVLRDNRDARARLGGPSELVVVEGATHLFEEPGALDQVAELATAWFVRHLAGSDVTGAGGEAPRYR